MAHEFNEKVAMDLKQWKGRWILHMIDMINVMSCGCTYKKGTGPSSEGSCRSYQGNFIYNYLKLFRLKSAEQNLQQTTFSFFPPFT